MTLIRKELMLHLLSARFHLAAALVIVTMTGGAVLHLVEHGRRMSDYRAAEEVRHEELTRRSSLGLPLFQLFSYYEQELTTRPAQLGFIAEAHERDLPNVVAVHAFRVDGPSTRQRSNPMLHPFDALDWSLIVGVVLSFAAIVLTFDAFAGEKEEGTLRLVLARPVPRWMLVVSKLAGAWAILMAAFVVAVLLQLLILVAGNGLALDGHVAGVVALAMLLCGLYVATFVLLGLTVSARQASAASALVVCLLVWALLVIVVPRSTVVLAHLVEPVEARDQAMQRAWRQVEQTTEEYMRLHPKKENAWWSGHWSPGESLDMASQIWAAHQREVNGWRDSWLRQVEAVRRLSWVSPTSLFSSALEQLTGTGLERYRDFMTAARRHRQAMEDRVRALYPLDPVDAPGLDPAAHLALEQLEVTISDLPVFQQPPRGVVQGVERALPFTAALAVIDLMLLLAATVAAVRYDVR